ncbi:MAG: BLUF domain-containing protein [Burkholderiaceae bacterium]|nr:BLUF domain-containing protein [Burkholderiaceae bacterium]
MTDVNRAPSAPPRPAAAAASVSAEALTRLLVICRHDDPGADVFGREFDARARRHRELGLTGVVTFGADHCVQLVEGPPQSVDTCLAELRAVASVRDVRVLVSAEGMHRVFPDWPLRLVFLPGTLPSLFAQALDDLHRGQHQRAGRVLLDALVTAAYC